MLVISKSQTGARRPLWEAGMDYAHGTGHGVGAALNVSSGVVIIMVFI